MMQQIFIGLMAEGNTDNDFLPNIIRRSFEEIRFEFQTEIDLNEVEIIRALGGATFNEKVEHAARIAFDNGLDILCVHTDADAPTAKTAYEERITPALENLNRLSDDFCKNIVPIVLVQMTEAWLLADLDLLRLEINAPNNAVLGINSRPETMADPKRSIEIAIQQTQRNRTKRRRRDLAIGDLYAPLGQMIELERLRQLPSFNVFEENVRNALRQVFGYNTT